MLKKVFHSHRAQCILLTFLLLGGMLFEFQPLQFLEKYVYDSLARLRRTPAKQPVVIVAIDDTSIEQIGGWPWPRGDLADVILRLRYHGTHTLGIGLLYSEMARNDAVREIQKIQDLPWKNLLTEKKRKLTKTQKMNLAKIDSALNNAQKHLNQDAALIEAVNFTHNVVLPLRFILDGSEVRASSKTNERLRLNSFNLAKKRDGETASLKKAAIIPPYFSEKRLTAREVIQPYLELSRKASGLGHINLIADDDNIVRSIPLIIDYQGRDFPSFALQATGNYFGIRRLNGLKAGRSGLVLRHLKIPTDSSYRMLIDYRAPQDSIRKYSYVDVFSKKIPAAAFKNKIVIIGLTATGIAPRYKTSLHTHLSGIEIAAHAIENLINQKFISRPGWAFALEAIVLFYFMFFLLFVIPKVNQRVGMLILGIFLITWLGVAGLLFIAYGYWIHVMAPIILTVIGFGIARHRRLSSVKQNQQHDLYKSFGLSLQSQERRAARMYAVFCH